MARPLGDFAIRRPSRLNSPIMAMLLNAVHDRHEGRVFVLQVGAGTGQGTPPILSRLLDDTWSALLIEPHPDYFVALETLHAESDRVAVLNLGISDVAANLPLYALTASAVESNPKLRPNRASLLRDRIAGPGIADADITSAEVPFLRMDSVLQELGIDSVQLLIVNAGGHEEQVLRSFDPGALKMSLALIRTTFGTAADTACIAQLQSAGLTLYRVGDWLAGLAPGLSVPLDDLLSFFNRGIGQAEVEE
jgi:FkbM family methyltransferase